MQLKCGVGMEDHIGGRSYHELVLIAPVFLGFEVNLEAFTRSFSGEDGFFDPTTIEEFRLAAQERQFESFMFMNGLDRGEVGNLLSGHYGNAETIRPKSLIAFELSERQFSLKTLQDHGLNARIDRVKFFVTELSISTLEIHLHIDESTEEMGSYEFYRAIDRFLDDITQPSAILADEISDFIGRALSKHNDLVLPRDRSLLRFVPDGIQTLVWWHTLLILNNTDNRFSEEHSLLPHSERQRSVETDRRGYFYEDHIRVRDGTALVLDTRTEAYAVRAGWGHSICWLQRGNQFSSFRDSLSANDFRVIDVFRWLQQFNAILHVFNLYLIQEAGQYLEFQEKRHLKELRNIVKVTKRLSLSSSFLLKKMENFKSSLSDLEIRIWDYASKNWRMRQQIQGFEENVVLLEKVVDQTSSEKEERFRQRVGFLIAFVSVSGLISVAFEILSTVFSSDLNFGKLFAQVGTATIIVLIGLLALRQR